MTAASYSPGSIESRAVEAAGGMRKPTSEQDGYVATATYDQTIQAVNLTYVKKHDLGLDSKRRPGAEWGPWLEAERSLTLAGVPGSFTVDVPGLISHVYFQMNMCVKTALRILVTEHVWLVHGQTVFGNSTLVAMTGGGGGSSLTSYSFTMANNGTDRIITCSYTPQADLTSFRTCHRSVVI